MANYGEVLTEHIGNKEILDDGEKLDVAQIYQRDVDWLNESDVVVTEVTQISMGVGYELGMAEKTGKKVICLHRPKQKRISAMILGNKYFTIYPYQQVEELKEILEKELK